MVTVTIRCPKRHRFGKGAPVRTSATPGTGGDGSCCSVPGGYLNRMPLVAAAVCPHPPLIVPEIAGGAAAELDNLRSACAGAIARLLAAEPTTVVIVGGGPGNRTFGPGTHDTFARFGVSLPVRLGRETAAGGARSFPLSVLVGGWLLSRAGAASVVARSVAETASAAECAAIGKELADLPDPVGLLVMGDGSACRGEKSPGYEDPRAQPYDDAVAAALADVDVDTLLNLDPTLAAELKVAGRAPWQVLAGAARATGEVWRGELVEYAVPYGVAYFVAYWEPAR